MADVLTTKVSTEGRVILPKAVRDQKNWTPGTSLTVEVTKEGVLLRAKRVFPLTKPEDVFGMLKYDGPPVSVEEMNFDFPRKMKRRPARGRT